MNRVDKIMNLQMYTAGENNNASIRIYSKQFRAIIAAVFAVKSHFTDFFAGGLEVVDGISEKATAFSLKTSDVACAITTGTVSAAGAYTNGYNTGANVAFGTGTGSSSRFGARTEVIYDDIDVPYTFNWTIHEGLDRHTVNNDFDQAIADRLELQAIAKVQMMNAQHGAYLSSIAGKTIIASAISEDGVKAIFNELSKYYVDINAVGTKIAKVRGDIYNAIVDSGLVTTAKGADVNINKNEVKMFKGFVLEEIPESEFVASSTTESTTKTTVSDVVYTYIQNSAKAFLGINTARTIESEDFDGVALQGAGKGGQYCPVDNRKAVAKVTYTTTETVSG